MAKFLKQAPVKKQKTGNLGFAIGLVVYAIVFIAAAAIFLNWFWGFIEGYELSRPKVTIQNYMDSLTDEHILSYADDLIAQIDHNIQSEEACKEVILDVLSDDITYARKSSECTDTKQLFMLRCGTQVIGSFTIEAGEADEYGFAPWNVTGEEFDFSFLLGTSVSVTAPENYPVYVNGVALDSSYITVEETVPYGVFEEFYDDFDLPKFKKVTYEAGPFLGQFEMSVTDPDGLPYTLDENTDLDAFVDNCTEAEIKELREFTEEFIRRYVIFTGCANDARFDNYANLVKLIVVGSDLDDRLKNALDGLQFAQSRGDKIAAITIHHFVNIGNGKYLVDLNYLVDTTGLAGVVQTSNNLKLIITETENGLKTESLVSY